MGIKIQYRDRNLIMHSCWSIVFWCCLFDFILIILCSKTPLEKELKKEIKRRKGRSPLDPPRPDGLLAEAQLPSSPPPRPTSFSRGPARFSHSPQTRVAQHPSPPALGP